MRKIFLGLVFGFAVIASAGTAAGLYLASQDGDADNERQVADAQETPTPKPALTEGPGATPSPLALRWPNPFPTAEEVEIDPDGKYLIRHRADGCDYSEDQRTVRPEDGRLWVLLRSPECAPVGLLIPGDQSALEVVAIPTVATPATPEPRTPTPTPEFGVCPTPVRTTPEDVPEPPPPFEAPGRHVQGGTSFAEGYVTVHLPAEREFVINTGQSSAVDGVDIVIYDVQARSTMIIRGDGCEVSRLVRDRTADPVFDEIMASVEVGTTYICPPAVRTTPEDLSEPSEPEPPSQIPGEHVQGGTPYQCGQVTLQVPAGREFIIGVGVGGPGPFCHIYDVQTQSSLFIDPPGCESGRFVRDPAADAVFDQIVATLEVER